MSATLSSLPKCGKESRPGKAASPLHSPRWLDDPDVGLMLRVREGDNDSFAVLVRAYGRRVLGFFRRETTDRAEAEDLTQEVFLRLYRYRRRYKPHARFATWIFFIARNVARNAHRTHRRHPIVQMNPEAEDQQTPLGLSLSGHAEGPSCSLERDELARVVRAAVAELGERKRTALELHQFEDRTYAEVAKVLRMTAKAAKSLLYRARLELRTVLLPHMS
jgi:RNA polymerase sigma-70 factor, ECF subfamily